MRVALIYPPTADPTMPYVSLPLLTAVLRQAGHTVRQVDANVEGWRHVLRPRSLQRASNRCQEQLRKLEAMPSLSHTQQLHYLALHEALSDAGPHIAAEVEQGIATLTGRESGTFYDDGQYGGAVAALDAAARLLAAAHWPVALDFLQYRSPFSFLDAAQIRTDSKPAMDPFRSYYEADLLPRIAAFAPDVIGISVVFPGQLMGAWSLARAIKEAMPAALLVGGGPALTQRMAPLSEAVRLELLAPFDTAVLFEGERGLVAICEELAAGRRTAGVVVGERVEDLATVPCPHFSGLDLSLYLSPEPVIPYDASRGCYWGRCAFCHYGLSDCGTAPYRERPAARIVADLRRLKEQTGARIFYFSHDSMAPRLALAVARQVRELGLDVRWAGDIRPEPTLDAERCRELAAGGALAFSLGIESGSARVLRIMDKGLSPEDARSAVRAMARAGIAVEAMTFTDFPTETRQEALETVRVLDSMRDELSLFICGEFALTAGSRVAASPSGFGLAETWSVDGDRFRTALFYREQRASKSDRDREAVLDAVLSLSRRFCLRGYPWAGSLSTAHTLLWYDRRGPGAFRAGGRQCVPARTRERLRSRYDVNAMERQAFAAEADIWDRLTRVERAVSPERYRAQAALQPRARPARG
jgi:hypothetical protein